MKTKTNLLVTVSTKDQVKSLLKANGYEAQFLSTSKDFHHSLDGNKRFVSLRYKRHEGYYIATSSVWITDMEDVEAFAREALEAKMLYVQLAKILGGAQ